MIYRVCSSVFGRSQLLRLYVLPWLYALILSEYHFESVGMLLEIKIGQERSMETFYAKELHELDEASQQLPCPSEKYRPNKRKDKTVALG